MIGLLQRVSSARVEVAGRTVGQIGAGLLVLVCAERGDTAVQAAALLERILGYRVFPDDRGRMNRSLRDLAEDVRLGVREPGDAGLLLVPQFTLAADTSSGTRPGFGPAAAPERARELFDTMLERARSVHDEVGSGEFGAHMSVALVNDGPVTFWLRVAPPADST